MSYIEDARRDAADTVETFLDEIVEQLLENGEASDDLLNGYSGGDEHHHNSHIDRSYSLLDAAKLLDDLDEFEEGDSGLWEGLEPRAAISAQAAYTFGNAVASLFRELISEINDDEQVAAIHEAYLAVDAIDEDAGDMRPEIVLAMGDYHGGEESTLAATKTLMRLMTERVHEIADAF